MYFVIKKFTCVQVNYKITDVYRRLADRIQLIFN